MDVKQRHRGLSFHQVPPSASKLFDRAKAWPLPSRIIHLSR